MLTSGRCVFWDFWAMARRWPHGKVCQKESTTRTWMGSLRHFMIRLWCLANGWRLCWHPKTLIHSDNQQWWAWKTRFQIVTTVPNENLRSLTNGKRNMSTPLHPYFFLCTPSFVLPYLHSICTPSSVLLILYFSTCTSLPALLHLYSFFLYSSVCTPLHLLLHLYPFI